MYIYQIKNLVNGKLYVGLTRNNIYERFLEHSHSSSGCVSMRRAIQKYGKDSFEVTLLEQCENEDQLYQQEIYWIAKLRTLVPDGYNLKSGGAGGNHHQETKDKMSKTRKGKHPHWATLASNTKESREKVGAKLRGRKRSPETVKAAREGQRWRMKPIKDQYGNVYENVNDAAKKLELNRGNLHGVLSGTRGHIKGYVFTYVDPSHGKPIIKDWSTNKLSLRTK